jgi:hypothetical protein
MRLWKTDHFKLAPFQRVVIDGVPHRIVGWHGGGPNPDTNAMAVTFEPEANFQLPPERVIAYGRRQS